MGDQHMRVPFGVVHNLAEPLVVGTSFIERFVKGIFSMEQQHRPSSASTSRNYFGIYATVASGDWDTELPGPQDQYRRSTKQ